MTFSYEESAWMSQRICRKGKQNLELLNSNIPLHRFYIKAGSASWPDVQPSEVGGHRSLPYQHPMPTEGTCSSFARRANHWQFIATPFQAVTWLSCWPFPFGLVLWELAEGSKALSQLPGHISWNHCDSAALQLSYQLHCVSPSITNVTASAATGDCCYVFHSLKRATKVQRQKQNRACSTAGLLGCLSPTSLWPGRSPPQQC